MSKITLTFEEYQDIRGAMAYARGYIEGLTGKLDVPPGFTRLEDGIKILEAARWRTEDGS